MSNPFTDHTVTGSTITSEYWRLECATASRAQRTSEIIKGAYEAGRRDHAKQLRALLEDD